MTVIQDTKELLKGNKKKASNLIKKWAKDLNRWVTKEETQMGNEHVRTPHPMSSRKHKLKQQQDITTHLFLLLLLLSHFCHVRLCATP